MALNAAICTYFYKLHGSHKKLILQRVCLPPLKSAQFVEVCFKPKEPLRTVGCQAFENTYPCLSAWKMHHTPDSLTYQLEQHISLLFLPERHR